MIINELSRNKITIDENSSDLWRHIRTLNQNTVNIVKTHNAQMDVVKGLWDEILKIPADTLKLRLKIAGIQNV